MDSQKLSEKSLVVEKFSGGFSEKLVKFADWTVGLFL